MDFTFENYKNILLELKKDFIFKHFDDYSEKSAVYLRHDVDIFPENIPPITEVEMQCGIQSTFFVLANSEFYNILSARIIKILNQSADKGFVIGLHIDASNLQSLDQLTNDIVKRYEFLSNYIPLKRIFSFHRPIDRLLNNIIIPGFINVYEDRFFRDIRYYSDSNRRSFYESLKRDVESDGMTSIQLLTHPYWWDIEHLDIQSLADRLGMFHCQRLRSELKDNTKVYRQYFDR